MLDWQWNHKVELIDREPGQVLNVFFYPEILHSSSSSSILGAKKYLTCPMSSISYSTTSGTSGDRDRMTWEESGVAFVKKFKYLKKSYYYQRMNSNSPQSKCKIYGLLHVNNDRLFLLVDICALGEIDLCVADVALGREGDAGLGHCDLD